MARYPIGIVNSGLKVGDLFLEATLSESGGRALTYDEAEARDQSLLERIRSLPRGGDPVLMTTRRALMAQLLAPYQTLIESLVAARLRGFDRPTIEDWTQETWRRLVQEIVSGKSWEFSFREIVIARAKYTVLDAIRAVARNREMPSDAVTIQEQDDPESLAVGRATMDQFLAQLSDQDRLIAEACWLQGISSAAAGAELGIKANAVDQRKSRIRRRFREFIRHE